MRVCTSHANICVYLARVRLTCNHTRLAPISARQHARAADDNFHEPRSYADRIRKSSLVLKQPHTHSHTTYDQRIYTRHTSHTDSIAHHYAITHGGYVVASGWLDGLACSVCSLARAYRSRVCQTDKVPATKWEEPLCAPIADTKCRRTRQTSVARRAAVPDSL